MGEILLATTIILLAAVLYYVNKNKPSNKKELIPGSINKITPIDNQNRISNLYYSNYDNYEDGMYTPDKRYLGKNQYDQNNKNGILQLENEYYNASNINNSINKYPLILNNSCKNKIKINNLFITPTKDDSFLDNIYRGTGLNEFTSAVSRPELIIKNKRKSYDDYDLDSDIYNKTNTKNLNDCSDRIVIKDLSRKPALEKLLEILIDYRKRLVTSKYLDPNFYKNLLVSLMQRFIENIRGEEVVRNNNYFVKSPYNNEIKRESINNIQNKNEFNVTENNRNTRSCGFRNEAFEEINNFNPNNLNELRSNMIHVNENSFQDLNEYIRNNDLKKVKLRDLIFAEYNTHQNYSLNRNNFSANNHNQQLLNHPNSVREYVFEKYNIPYHNNFNLKKKVNQQDDKIIYCGNKGGIDTYYLKPKTDIDWDYDVINSYKKSAVDKKNVYDQLIQDDRIVDNQYLNNYQNKDLKIVSKTNQIDSNYYLEELVHNKDISVKKHQSQTQNDKEVLVSDKSDSFSQKYFKKKNGYNDKKFSNHELNIINAVQKDKSINDLNIANSPQSKLLKEFTPKIKNVQVKKTISDIENYNNNCKGIVDNTKNNTIKKHNSHLKNNYGPVKRQPLVNFVENKENINLNYDNNHCEQIGTLKNNKLSELLINKKTKISQDKVSENNFFDYRKYKPEDIPKDKNGEKIRTTIFKKSEEINQTEDESSLLNNSISLNYDNEENKFSNNDIIPSPIPGENTDQIGNHIQKLPSTIKKNDVIDANLLLSSENKMLSTKKDIHADSFEKPFTDNEIDNNPRRFTMNSDNFRKNTSKNNRKTSKSKKEASNFRKKSNKKMTFAPSEYNDFSELELIKSKENKIASLIAEENESNLTKTNLITTPSINIKNSKQKNYPTENKNPLINIPHTNLFKENFILNQENQ